MTGEIEMYCECGTLAKPVGAYDHKPSEKLFGNNESYKLRRYVCPKCKTKFRTKEVVFNKGDNPTQL